MFVVLPYLMLGMKVVRQGYQYTIERLGKVTALAQPRLALIVALSDQIRRKAR